MPEDERESWDYDSGPFCRHWSELYDCDRTCKRCGVKCSAHEDTDCEYTDDETDNLVIMERSTKQ